jgi:hypothetical protein
MSNAVRLYHVISIQRDTLMETRVVMIQTDGNNVPKLAGNTSEILATICQTTRYHNLNNILRH